MFIISFHLENRKNSLTQILESLMHLLGDDNELQIKVTDMSSLDLIAEFSQFDRLLVTLDKYNYKDYGISLECLNKYKLSLRIRDQIEFAFTPNESKLNEELKQKDTFFFNLYKSLPNGLGYVSWVDVGNYYKFDEKYKLDQFEFYDAVFNDKPLFYHCVTTKAVYEEDHTKEQLLNCPFIKVEEWEDGSIEMLHYNHPLDIESEENIEQIRKVRKYLSENNLYS